jgi:plastocyanin
VEIAAGDSITWYNGVDVPLPHTVTFINDLGNTEKIGLPFYVSNNTQFTPVLNNLGEPLEETTGNGTRIVMMLNARALTPTVITADNKVMELKKDSIYTLNGTEKFVNSGPLLSLDKKQTFDYSFSNSFTVVFNKPGFYEYTCLFHPWMIGKLLVKP